MMQITSLTPYDLVPYPAGAYQQSHPGHLATLAKLFGMTPADIRHCRVLELGCADGSNLIPMACALPGTTFTGIDLAATRITAGRETIAALGLRNIELRHQDIRELDAEMGSFDYIIAHGVYSWVPAAVQDRILSVCSEFLSAQGVAFVSYNTNPGWRLRGMLRDMMLYHSRKFDEPQKQIEQARALINWLSQTVQSENNPYGMLLRSELEHLKHWEDTYLRHDALAEINTPVYFHQFIEQASRHGLQYLAEAEFPTMLASNYAAPVDETLKRLGRDIIEMEQYMDFLRNRLFRQTLLCHREIHLERSLGPSNITGFRVAACLTAANPELDLDSAEVAVFCGPNQLTVSTRQPIVKAALSCLESEWPRPLAFSELVARSQSRLKKPSRSGSQTQAGAETDEEILGGMLLTCFTKGLCELHLHPLEFRLAPGERPVACPFARLLAARGQPATNRRHERVRLDKLREHLLPLLDGGRDRGQLIEALAGLIERGVLELTLDGQPVSGRDRLRDVLGPELEKQLARLGRNALLIA